MNRQVSADVDEGSEKKAIASTVPDWLNEEYFENIVAEEFEEFSKITSFKAIPGSEAGDNYASVMVRILMEIELKDGSKRKFPLMMKTTHSSETISGQVTQQMNIFDKEQEMYENIIPVFEKMYLEKGKKICFAPKSYKLAKSPNVETVVLEDLSQRNFKNANRLQGLDMDHVRAVLKILSQFHAASAVHFENYGPYSEKFYKGFFDPAMRDTVIEMYKPMLGFMREAFDTNLENGEHYTSFLLCDMETWIDKNIEMCRVKPDQFNVLNHGDSWCNNIMFNYTEEGKLNETILVDYQMCKYGSPAQDLLYFIFSSPSQDIRLTQFNYMIKYYHDNLIENLKLLEYCKPLPSLTQLHIDILKNHGWAHSTIFGVLAIVLLEDTENANIDNFVKQDEEAIKFKLKVFSNPKYIRCLNEILPWLENKGMLE